VNITIVVHAVDEHYEQVNAVVSTLNEVLDDKHNDLFAVMAALSIEILSRDSIANPHWYYDEDDNVEYHMWLHYNNTTLFDFVARSVTMFIEPLTKRVLN
jgi:hypothetical protein